MKSHNAASFILSYPVVSRNSRTLLVRKRL